MVDDRFTRLYARLQLLHDEARCLDGFRTLVGFSGNASHRTPALYDADDDRRQMMGRHGSC